MLQIVILKVHVGAPVRHRDLDPHISVTKDTGQLGENGRYCDVWDASNRHALALEQAHVMDNQGNMQSRRNLSELWPVLDMRLQHLHTPALATKAFGRATVASSIDTYLSGSFIAGCAKKSRRIERTPAAWYVSKTLSVAGFSSVIQMTRALALYCFE